jgi:hypothetical protein
MEVEKLKKISNLAKRIETIEKTIERVSKVTEFTEIKITGEDGAENKSDIYFNQEKDRSLIKKILSTINQHFSDELAKITREIKEL